jgi:hypothetical protein
MRYSLLWCFGIALGLAACSPEAVTDSGKPNPGSALPLAASVAAGSWRVRAPYPKDLFDARSASITDATTHRTILYVIGGRPSMRLANKVTRAVMAYDIASDTWRSRAQFPVRLYSANGVVEINGKLYVPGGVTTYFDSLGRLHNRLLNTLYRYDAALDRWTRLKDMPYSSASGLSSSYGGRLYVAVFCQNTSLCGNGELLRYNPATNAWKILGRTPHSPAFAGGGFVNGKFYLVDMDGHVDVYDVATDRWSAGPAAPFSQPPYVLCPSASATLQARIYLVGCHVGDASTGMFPMQVFDPANGNWSQTAATPILAGGHWWSLGRVVVNGMPGLELVGGLYPTNNAQFTP